MIPADHKPIEGTRMAEYRQGYAEGYAKGVQAWTWREIAILCVCMGAVDVAIRRFWDDRARTSAEIGFA